ncbi:amino acid ABC transporter ATP-binding protein [Columbia Basin potato purple top phytoplasma]|uniref:Amino acid ABC transporter ATP-binding protein n=1 Tax=Columbia Basin potato purple top phytoplasma TaxID=307134 RepID=A0ABT5L9I0_9MOLU|nr:amino acid ABC transporter ATP-binding protein [Columbia Basin potato purple top phytoplasma]MDC9032245.1 amino acid ABC transporter ATP-binding protein [Columbia Basin potato purple top phytoplasma]
MNLDSKYIIKIKNLNKSFHNKLILKNINLNIVDKEIFTIIGYSGSGKSTLLRCLNLLEEPDFGEIIINNENIVNKNINISKVRTKVGMVFQSFNLFEEKNVLENCCLAPIKVLKISPSEAEEIALKKLRYFGLEKFAYKNIKQLSGGQKQRIAIIRALCMEPEILLLDEPTSALDPEASEEVLSVLKKLVSQKKMTFVIVSHEIKFAKKVSNTICFMEDGNIIEKGPSKEVFETNKYPKSKSFFEEF